jgi:hypothetical protein
MFDHFKITLYFMQHVRSDKFILVLNYGFNILPLLLLLIFY